MSPSTENKWQHGNVSRDHYRTNNERLLQAIAIFFLSNGRGPTTWPANNCLQICLVSFKRVLLQIIFCSCAIGTTLSKEKWQIASLSCQEVIKIWQRTWWSNDKTIIKLGYRKISRFVSVSQINYLPKASANNGSAHLWQITIFRSTSSNNF